jgi:hypothetical protein
VLRLCVIQLTIVLFLRLTIISFEPLGVNLPVDVKLVHLVGRDCHHCDVGTQPQTTCVAIPFAPRCPFYLVNL